MIALLGGPHDGTYANVKDHMTVAKVSVVRDGIRSIYLTRPGGGVADWIRDETE